MARFRIQGRNQALNGDRTTTGAVCLASGTGFKGHGREALRVQDKTTPCPVCGEVGTLVEGVQNFVIQGRPAVVDGALVACKCPAGRNRVIALGGPGDAASTSTTQQASQTQTAQAAPSPAAPPSRAFSTSASASPALVEPGFHIVQRGMSFEQVLESLGATHSLLPISLLQRLNPTFAEGFKAGEIFVLGSPGSSFACSAQETELMMVAEKARESLAILSDEEANFMMRHIGEIAGVLNGASQSMGVGKDMLERGLGQVKDTLKGIETLHQQQFALHGHLNSADFFAKRKELYQHLSAQLRAGFLNKTLNLGSHDTLRRDLGISTKSLVHHWKKAGGPGQIPGYATHLHEVAKMSNYLKYGGYAAIGLGAGSSYLKVQEACRAGETDACKKIRITETGSFAGGLAGGFAGGKAASLAAKAVCSFGVYGKAVCGIAMIAGGSYGAGVVGEEAGEWLGELTYETFHD
ncbi:PAAR domain-containing protein [Pseudomonas sp. NPDC089396]|uniref:PAAR domain-containing protein n=1 Tax=Pseudomonas sp. NPDC089396 TaxID=3364461 RepID=UPI003833CFAB